MYLAIKRSHVCSIINLDFLNSVTFTSDTVHISFVIPLLFSLLSSNALLFDFLVVLCNMMPAMIKSASNASPTEDLVLSRG